MQNWYLNYEGHSVHPGNASISFARRAPVSSILSEQDETGTGKIWLAVCDIFNIIKRQNQQEVQWKLFSQML
jgi:hypothetical protein